MTVTTLGRVNVPTPGTPVQLTTATGVRIAKLFVQVIPGLTGKGYLGTRSLNRASMDGVMRILWPNSSGGFSDQFELQSSDGSNSLTLGEYWIDMDVASEGLLVTYWTA